MKFNLSKINSNDLFSIQTCSCAPQISEVTYESLRKRQGKVFLHKYHQENNFKSKKYPTILKPIAYMAVCVTLALSNTKTLKLALFFQSQLLINIPCLKVAAGAYSQSSNK